METIIHHAFEKCNTLTPHNASAEIKEAVTHVINQLDRGELRVAEKIKNQWITHEWIKKSILLYFRICENKKISGNFTNYFDKLPLKFSNHFDFEKGGIRVVPPALSRHGAYIAANTILMPSYINIGAYIDSGTLVDTWVTVGSCAQIGKNVHLSGGVGIGGVLEPLQTTPTIIEDNCFIGARSEIVEGVICETGAVISMGVFIGQSTKIYNRETGEISYGRVPAGAVVVPGSLPAKDGSHSLSCAVIIKQIDEKTRKKTSLNTLLRD